LCFSQNRFEQLCINFANEKLQQHFNKEIFEMEQEVYLKEGLNVDKVEFVDNQPCLDVIEKRPTGILCMVDEELRLPKGSDAQLLTKMHQVRQFLVLFEYCIN
jgi:myosin heavy subunit